MATLPLSYRSARNALWMLRHAVAVQVLDVRDFLGASTEVLLQGKYPVRMSVHAGGGWVTVERDAHDLFLSWMKPGVKVLDVGANIGRYSLYTTEMTGRKCRVLAIEADPTTFRVLRRNLELNSLLHLVSIYHCAAWDSESVLEFYASRYAGTSSAAQDWASTIGARKVKVPARALDVVCAETDFQPDVIKMDIEGAEFHALKGLEETLRRNHPAILLELHPQAMLQLGTSIDALQDYMLGLGYRFATVGGEPIADLRAHTDDHKPIQAVWQG